MVKKKKTLERALFSVYKERMETDFSGGCLYLFALTM